MSGESILKRRRRARRLAHDRATGLPTIVMLLSLATAAGHSPRSAIFSLERLVDAGGAVGVVAKDFAMVSELSLIHI